MNVNQLNVTKNSRLFALGVVVNCGMKNPESAAPMLNSALKSNADILALYFNIDSHGEIPKAEETLKSILAQITKPLMVCGCGKHDIDKYLLPELIKILDRESIISYAVEETYKQIVPEVIKGNHYLVLKTPIDINLAKELNILSIDNGLKKDKIIMNTDIGGLGYGYEYGYSILEKICLESENDEYLNLPIISEAALESLKTKEARMNTAGENRGGLGERAKMIELAAASGILAAGANILVLTNSENIDILKGMAQ